MNPEDQQIILQYGITYYQESIPMIVTILTYGIFILATLIAVRAIVSKSLTRSRILLLACLIAIGIGFTWDVFYFAMSNLILIKYGLVQVVRGPEGLELAGVIADKKELPLLYMSSWAGVIAYVLSDAVVVWRAWILFQRSTLLRFLLVFLMFANAALNMADCIWVDAEMQSEESNRSVLDWLSIVSSLAVNMFATGLIAWTAWSHRRTLAQTVLHKRSKALNILLLFVESGAIYCAIQTLYIIFTVLEQYDSARFWLASSVISTISIASASLYPAIVTILVSGDRPALVETFKMEASVSGPVSTRGSGRGTEADTISRARSDTSDQDNRF